MFEVSEFTCRQCRRQTSSTLFSSTTSDRGCWTRFIKERPSRAAGIFGSANKGSSMVDDVALPHFILSVWEFSNNVFPEQRIRRCWPTVGPVPSVELNLLDFYHWGHLKSTVFNSEVGDVQELQQWIRNGFWLTVTTTGIFQRVRRSLFRRPILSFEAQGGHFERFL